MKLNSNWFQYNTCIAAGFLSSEYCPPYTFAKSVLLEKLHNTSNYLDRKNEIPSLWWWREKSTWLNQRANWLQDDMESNSVSTATPQPVFRAKMFKLANLSLRQERNSSFHPQSKTKRVPWAALAILSCLIALALGGNFFDQLRSSVLTTFKLLFSVFHFFSSSC